ncbi:MAG: nucleotidyl transferase AbiEii/AbiGii toxin family protein [Anaerolineae bacterium]|nr:nucleotidyl transferase AbiEii/AbiGii toxin family protein [Anaerolineae bacterium]
MTHILDFYRDSDKREEFRQLLILGAQKHPDGLPDFFLEKDLWVTEILRLLYDEKLMGDFAVAFKGGTALSKCWKVIERFSEDIDLSIHWADLAEADDESSAWEQTTKSRSQRDKFRKDVSDRLTKWSAGLVERLNQRFVEYGIEGLGAELETDSPGEKINIRFPKVTADSSEYHLDYVLLEFGGRNRGRPTVTHVIDSYLAAIPELSELDCPKATVQVYEPSYILWEKLTALHQFSTMEKEPNKHRLARHWYDVDCLLQKGIVDPLASQPAMNDVVEMKKQRWAEKGVDYEAVLDGKMKLIPDPDRLAGIQEDHNEAIQGRMFYTQPDDFNQIVARLSRAQDDINKKIETITWVKNNVRWACSGAWKQAIVRWKDQDIRSQMTLKDKPDPAIAYIVNRILEN